MNGWNDEDEEDEQFSTPIDNVDLRMFFYEVRVSLSINVLVVLKRLPRRLEQLQETGAMLSSLNGWRMRHHPPLGIVGRLVKSSLACELDPVYLLQSFRVANEREPEAMLRLQQQLKPETLKECQEHFAEAQKQHAAAAAAGGTAPA